MFHNRTNKPVFAKLSLSMTPKSVIKSNEGGNKSAREYSIFNSNVNTNPSIQDSLYTSGKRNKEIKERNQEETYGKERPDRSTSAQKSTEFSKSLSKSVTKRNTVLK